MFIYMHESVMHNSMSYAFLYRHKCLHHEIEYTCTAMYGGSSLSSNKHQIALC